MSNLQIFKGVIKMKVLILSFSNNKVNEDSFIPNEKGLTFSCVDECIDELNKQEIQN